MSWRSDHLAFLFDRQTPLGLFLNGMRRGRNPRLCGEVAPAGPVPLAWPPLAAATDVHSPKMRGATAPTTSQTLTPSAAPAPSAADAISISPSALVDAAITTFWAAQAAANAPSRASVARVVGLNFLQFFFDCEGGCEGVGWSGKRVWCGRRGMERGGGAG